MPRWIALEWPDPKLFEGRAGEPFRILAVSDQLDPTLTDARTRTQVGRVDLVLGCGDMRAADLAFVADATGAPLLFVRGNHDGDASWDRAATHLPEPIESSKIVSADGLRILGLPWPGPRGRLAIRDERTAWRQAIRATIRLLPPRRPLIVMSHVPPLGIGDVPSNGYHRGFRAYRWLFHRFRPALWLHGHTSLASVPDWRIDVTGTTFLNVTGAVVIELTPPKPRADAG